MQLTYRETMRIRVPSRYVETMGRDHVHVDAYQDANGGEWRPMNAPSPYRCSWCEQWCSGQYWSNPPAVVCPSHVNVHQEA